MLDEHHEKGQDGSSSISSYYIKLENSINYTINVLLKGEDPEGNTVSQNNQQIISVDSQLGILLKFKIQKNDSRKKE